MADTANPLKRWDTDHRYTGVADAAPFAPTIDELASLARRKGWVAEEPQAHLVPHLRGAHIDGLELADCQAGQDGVLNILAHHRPGAGRAAIRQQAWALIGTIAEPAASVREHLDGDAVVFEVVTGIPDGGPFASHGHSLRLTFLPATA